MAKYYVLSPMILAATLIATTALREQEPVPPRGQLPALAPERQTDAEDSAVFDDDGGRVFIVRRGQTLDMSSLKFHGGEIIRQPRQVSIFLGNGWSDPSKRRREASLAATLTGLVGSAEGAELERRGVTNLALEPLQYEELGQFESRADGDKSVSDLDIQQVLSVLLQDRRIVQPDESNLYTVFLSSDLQSTIGGLLGRKHYLAYHNFFHVDAGQVRYVVVPFESNRKAARAVAAQGLVKAILDPVGNGWF